MSLTVFPITFHMVNDELLSNNDINYTNKYSLHPLNFKQDRLSLREDTGTKDKSLYQQMIYMKAIDNNGKKYIISMIYEPFILVKSIDPDFLTNERLSLVEKTNIRIRRLNDYIYMIYGINNDQLDKIRQEISSDIEIIGNELPDLTKFLIDKNLCIGDCIELYDIDVQSPSIFERKIRSDHLIKILQRGVNAIHYAKNILKDKGNININKYLKYSYVYMDENNNICLYIIETGDLYNNIDVEQLYNILNSRIFDIDVIYWMNIKPTDMDINNLPFYINIYVPDFYKQHYPYLDKYDLENIVNIIMNTRNSSYNDIIEYGDIMNKTIKLGRLWKTPYNLVYDKKRIEYFIPWLSIFNRTHIPKRIIYHTKRQYNTDVNVYSINILIQYVIEKLATSRIISSSNTNISSESSILINTENVPLYCNRQVDNIFNIKINEIGILNDYLETCIHRGHVKIFLSGYYQLLEKGYLCISTDTFLNELNNVIDTSKIICIRNGLLYTKEEINMERFISTEYEISLNETIRLNRNHVHFRMGERDVIGKLSNHHGKQQYVYEFLNKPIFKICRMYSSYNDIVFSDYNTNIVSLGFGKLSKPEFGLFQVFRDHILKGEGGNPQGDIIDYRIKIKITHDEMYNTVTSDTIKDQLVSQLRELQVIVEDEMIFYYYQLTSGPQLELALLSNLNGETIKLGGCSESPGTLLVNNISGVLDLQWYYKNIYEHLVI